MAKKKKLIKGPWSCLHLPGAGGHRWTKDDIRLLKKLYPHGNTRKIAACTCPGRWVQVSGSIGLCLHLPGAGGHR